MANTAQAPQGARDGELRNPVRAEAERLGTTLPPLLVAAEQLSSAIVLGVREIAAPLCARA